MVSAAITTICDMVEHARIRLDDIAPVSDTPTTNLELIQQAAEEADEGDLLWTTGELRHFANEAIKEVAIRTQCLRDSARNVTGLTSYPLDAEEYEITVDPRVLVIRRVWWDDVVMAAESEAFMDESSSSWRTDTTDEPKCYVVQRTSRKLRTVRVTTVDGIISMDVIRLPLEVIEEGIPEIPQHYLADCLHWMMHLAYLKNDADTHDPGKAKYYSDLFEQRVGPPKSAKLQVLEYGWSGRRRGRVYYY